MDNQEAAVQAEPGAEADVLALWRRLLTEFVGTLLFVGIGTGVATLLLTTPIRNAGRMVQVLRDLGQPVQGLPEFFAAQLAFTLGDLLAVAFGFAAALAVVTYAFGGVSGAHVNPAVTFALTVARRFPVKELPLYWVVQVAGGIAGAFVVAAIYGQSGASIRNNDVLFGATVVADNIEVWQALVAEALIGFVLMTAIMGVAIDPRAPKGWSGLVIGLALGAGILVTGPATGGSANFARTLGPYVASLPYDVGSIPWGDLLIYAGGPLLGATAAALIYETVTGLPGVAPARPPEPAPTEPEEEMAMVGEGTGEGSTPLGP